MPDVCALLHAGLLVTNLDRARVFYESVLGLKVCPNRPDLPYPGEWYELGGGQQLHLMQLPNPDAASVRPEHGGRDHHIALGVRNMAELKSRLDAAGVRCTA
ncbi:MAG: VOC family protein, partial [Thiobacillus sp.]|nr:VOC family protein [Thiobacillus sp.]